MSKVKTFARWAAVGLLAVVPLFANTVVGLELALLVDVSGSVDASEFTLQKTGYVQAFQSAAVQNAILNSVHGSIAATLIYWSGGAEQSQAVGWMLIDSAASANAFAAAINGAARPYSGLTAPGSAINFARPGFASNTFDGDRQIIDVSGDGSENDGDNTLAARNAALAAGIDQINGLVILGSEFGLEAWYNANVKGGTGAFVSVANDFGDFATAIEGKLVREISNIPEPSTVVLTLMALGFGSVVTRRRRSRAQ